MSLLFKSTRVLAAGMARRAVPVAARTLPTAASMFQQQRFYADKKAGDAASGKKPAEHSSILNDDLLEKAGLNSDQVKADKEKFDEEAKKAEDEVFGEDGPDEFSKTKRRRNNTKSTLDKKKERLSKLFWYSVLGGIAAGTLYLGRDWDPNTEPELYNSDENGYTPSKIWRRLRKRTYGVSDVFTEPAFTELLPPPPPEPYRHPLTLVLELDDTLVHSDWNYQKGWRTAKRPGLDYFLGYLSQYYEIVIFSKSSMAFAEPTVAKLDPYHAFISYSLYKEVCRVKEGKVMKDLSLMNRPLEKLIMIDPHGDCGSLQPENNIDIPEWKGEKDDQLIGLIPFLEYLATQPSVKDVRPVLASFDDKKQIPKEFAMREQRLRKAWEEEQKSKQENSWLAKLLGMPPAMRYQHKMPLDMIREQGQKNYENMAKYLAENGEKMLKEEQEKTKEMLQEQNLTLGKIVTEGMPTAEDVARQQAAAAEAAAAAAPAASAASATPASA